MKKKKRPLHSPSSEPTSTPLPEKEIRRLEKMAKMNLRPTRLTGPPGASLFDPRYVFLILAAHHWFILLENANERDDPRWINLFAAGMPRDMMRIDIVFTAMAYHEKYKDFAIHVRGVEVDEHNPDRGRGAWVYSMSHIESGEEINLHIWFIDIYLRNAKAHLIAHYTDPNAADPRFKQLTKWTGGVAIELMGHDLDDKQSSIRLIESDVLLTNMQNIMDAAMKAKHGGSSPRVPLSREKIRKYFAVFSEANAALSHAFNNRRFKTISKYSLIDRVEILKSVFPDEPPEIIESLASYNTRREIALQFGMYKAGDISIGTWKKDRLIDYLDESKELNGVTI